MNDILTNGTEIKQRILSEINNATQSIYLAMAYFTDREIAMAIVGAKNRNVLVDIILSSNIQNDTVKLMLKGANIIVHAFETGDARGIMHHKFCLIDNKITINGSYNYSINASNNNVENIHVSDDTSTYSQFFTEFERLKYNIDNQIAVNISTPTQITESRVSDVQPINIIDTFSKRLHDLIYSTAEIDTNKYRQNGLDNSRDNHGNLDIFRIECDHIKEKIKSYITDEGLGSKKKVLLSNISLAFESTKINLDTEKQEKINVEKRNYELEKKQVIDKVSEIKQEKSILESGNQNTGEKGLLQINKEIEKNKIERRALEQSFVIKKFWNVGTILSVFALVILSFILSIFFSSVFYKVFFEENVIRALAATGAEVKIPQIVDANAIMKIFATQGALFGIFSAIFFLIPILLTNLKLFGKENKYLFLFFLIIFDVITSTMVAFNQDYIRCLIEGKNSTLQIWEVVKRGEFWLIFLFGSAPLFLTHYLIDFIATSYKKSQRELVDSDKNKKIQFLDIEMIEFTAEKDILSNKIKEKEDVISQHNTKVISLETEINNRQTQIENRYSEMQNQIKAIYDDYVARITSGKIFTDVIFDSVIAAYKSGFIEYLPVYYSSEQVAIRVREIEQACETKI
jgi:hypothetical protein